MVEVFEGGKEFEGNMRLRKLIHFYTGTTITCNIFLQQTLWINRFGTLTDLEHLPQIV